MEERKDVEKERKGEEDIHKLQAEAEQEQAVLCQQEADPRYRAAKVLYSTSNWLGGVLEIHKDSYPSAYMTTSLT